MQQTGIYVAGRWDADTQLGPVVSDAQLLQNPAYIETGKAGSYEEALNMANDSEFGLTTGIMTQSLARAPHFRANARPGCVMVNLPAAGTDYHVPVRGRGASSYRPREQGSDAAECYTVVKTAYVAAGDPL